MHWEQLKDTMTHLSFSTNRSPCVAFPPCPFTLNHAVRAANHTAQNTITVFMSNVIPSIKVLERKMPISYASLWLSAVLNHPCMSILRSFHICETKMRVVAYACTSSHASMMCVG